MKRTVAIGSLLLIGALAVPRAGRGQGDEWALRRPSQYRLGASYLFYHFDNDFDPWHYVSGWVERREPRYSLIGRVNYAHRFDRSAVQFEADAYPLFSRALYAYFNFGYSPSVSFPRWRVGGELYVNLPGAWEASGGLRYLSFPGSEIGMFSGSLGKYYGNYWTSFRPFVVFDGGDTSWALVLTTRRYYADADNYIGLLASYGNAPDERISDRELDRLDNFLFEIRGKHPFSRILSWQWKLEYRWEELPGSRTRNRLGLGLGFESRF